MMAFPTLQKCGRDVSPRLGVFVFSPQQPQPGFKEECPNDHLDSIKIIINDTCLASLLTLLKQRKWATHGDLVSKVGPRPHLVLMYYLKYWYASCTKHRSSLTCIIITITMLLVSHHICSFFHHHQYNNPPTPSPLSSSRYSPCWYPTSSPLLAYSYDSWILCLPSGLPTHHLIQDIIFCQTFSQ